MRVVATAGHVDHGKSTLVKALTGTDPDRLDEEQRRGLTIELGFAHATLPSGQVVSFVDVPGHVHFLRNMLAGVGAVDTCLFVVAANEGWMPQSEEHLRILQLLGVQHAVVAITKTDLVDESWLDMVELDINERVRGTFVEGATIVRVSAVTDHGFDDLRRALEGVLSTTAAAIDRGRPRLWIDRVFVIHGSGTVITGTLVDGRLSRDDDVLVVPRNTTARVRGLQTHGETLELSPPGTRVAVNLGGVAHDQIERGDCLITPGRWRPTDRFDASFNVLAGLTHDVSRRGAYVAYIGARETPVRLRILGGDSLAPGASGLVRLFLPVALPLLPGDRYVLRESGRNETVGGGEVLDVAPVTKASQAMPDGSVERAIVERGWTDVGELELITGVAVEPTIGHWVASPAIVAATRDRLSEAVQAAGEHGLDLASVHDYERAVLAELDSVEINAGRARPAGRADPFDNHPLASAIAVGGLAPDQPATVDRATVRELVRRGVLVERDEILFHRDAIEAAALVAATLLSETPEGFTVSAFRERTGISRKFALPLLTELDARGVTRRREDLRLAGPRLPD